MALDPESPLVRWATFGKQVEYFLQSEIGSYLVKRAKAQADDAMDKLKDADPFDSAAVAAQQFRIKVSEGVIDFLAEAIQAGESATEQLKQESHGHQD